MFEWWIRRLGGAAKDAIETHAEVTADSDGTDFQSLAFDFGESLFDGWRLLRFGCDCVVTVVSVSLALTAVAAGWVTGEFFQQRLDCLLLFQQCLLQLVQLAVLPFKLAFEKTHAFRDVRFRDEGDLIQLLSSGGYQAE